MELDILYLVGLLVVWAGNTQQILRVIKTRSTKSISIFWIIAILVSIGIRLPRAVTSTYWVWQIGYVISFIICLVLVLIIVYYHKKYPRK